jgi:hypothetical protein
MITGSTGHFSSLHSLVEETNRMWAIHLDGLDFSPKQERFATRVELREPTNDVLGVPKAPGAPVSAISKHSTGPTYRNVRPPGISPPSFDL